MTDYLRLQDFYGRLIADVDVLAATQDYAAVLVPRNALHTIFVQRIVFSPSTHSDGKTLTFQDSTAVTPVIIAQYADEVVVDVQQENEWSVDFGPNGTPLTQGKNLDVIGSAAGLGGRLHIDAYQKLTGVGAP